MGVKDVPNRNFRALWHAACVIFPRC